MAERLYRSSDDHVITGVAGGVAQRLDIDPSIVRVVWVVAAVLTGGIALLVYIVMAVVVPYPPKGHVWPPSETSDASGPGSGGSTFGAKATKATKAAKADRDGPPAGLLIGLILVAIGAIFLVRELLPEIDLSISWPILALVVGVALVVLSIRPRRSSG